ncbi:MAG: extracellular solute-binding protein, partial [Deltaproteobacteria bacterium]|nr:extracellular solute-binding protein [Deltaproteobacteria bacterium]
NAPPDLAAKLTAAVPKERIGADESELLGLLETRAVDYAFLYRSTAEDHHLKHLILPPEINLSKPEFAARYAEVSVEVRMKQGDGRATLRGHPVTYGIAIPVNAANASEAEQFLAFLLGSEGQKVLRAAGLRPLNPAISRQAERVPEGLKGLLRASE